MTIKEFIEKAIKGGWKAKGILEKDMACIESIDILYGETIVNFQWVKYDHLKQPCKITREMTIFEILLDPKSFQAVGKVEKWKLIKVIGTIGGDPEDDVCIDGYVSNMHDMIDALIRGKSVEEYIKTL